jgi:hypothetical protein
MSGSAQYRRDEAISCGKRAFRVQDTNRLCCCLFASALRASFDSLINNAYRRKSVVFFTGLFGELGGTTVLGASGPLTFLPSSAPLPAALPLFATGTGGLAGSGKHA